LARGENKSGLHRAIVGPRGAQMNSHRLTQVNTNLCRSVASLSNELTS
jgi:hypothetical protein